MDRDAARHGRGERLLDLAAIEAEYRGQHDKEPRQWTLERVEPARSPNALGQLAIGCRVKAKP
ncbi:MAG: hypothetical protein HYX76_10045 [Acidobacteria bacterium]|nr:hypothetical protein [Acidobacteriota bacterium]